MSKILITGSLGYIGYPLCLELLNKNEYQLIGVDNCSRVEWVNRITSNYDNVKLYQPNTVEGDLTNRDFVNEIIKLHKPDIVIHLASQPSAPYSELNWERALFTQTNNLTMCINLLWGLRENGLQEKTRFITTTTTGIPGQAYKEIPEDATRNVAGSWYHITRGFDSDNCSLASRQWGQEIIELRTSIVYGIQTELMKTTNQVTRFDTDPYFGTALNRFVKQGLDKEQITVYGKGEQVKPFISLEDTVQSLVNSIDYKTESRHSIFNQMTEHISIKDLAAMVSIATGTKITHISNPRIEKEEWVMNFKNDRFLKLLHRNPKTIQDGISDIVRYFKTTLPYDYKSYTL